MDLCLLSTTDNITVYTECRTLTKASRFAMSWTGLIPVL